MWGGELEAPTLGNLFSGLYFILFSWSCLHWMEGFEEFEFYDSMAELTSVFRWWDCLIVSLVLVLLECCVNILQETLT